MDSRLCGNDSSYQDGLKALCKQPFMHGHNSFEQANQDAFQDKEHVKNL
jgi:hypothetical protein